MVLETLSIIAYRQPVTKMEIEKIRGVKSDHAVNRLVEYDLVYEAGRLDAPGRPALFATTEEFMRRFGVDSLGELPDVDPEQEAHPGRGRGGAAAERGGASERYGGIAGEKNQVPETDAAVRHLRGQMGIC